MNICSALENFAHLLWLDPVFPIDSLDEFNDDLSEYSPRQLTSCLFFSLFLKVPKCEIFDRSDFPDFYTIKSSWVGDLVVKILTYYFN